MKRLTAAVVIFWMSLCLSACGDTETASADAEPVCTVALAGEENITVYAGTAILPEEVEAVTSGDASGDISVSGDASGDLSADASGDAVSAEEKIFSDLTADNPEAAFVYVIGLSGDLQTAQIVSAQAVSDVSGDAAGDTASSSGNASASGDASGDAAAAFTQITLSAGGEDASGDASGDISGQTAWLFGETGVFDVVIHVTDLNGAQADLTVTITVLENTYADDAFGGSVPEGILLLTDSDYAVQTAQAAWEETAEAFAQKYADITTMEELLEEASSCSLLDTYNSLVRILGSSEKTAEDLVSESGLKPEYETVAEEEEALAAAEAEEEAQNSSGSSSSGSSSSGSSSSGSSSSGSSSSGSSSSGSSSSGSSSSSAAPYYNTSYAQQVLTLINQERAAQGLSALTMNSAAQSAADVRAAELVTLFSHYRPDGTVCFTALDEAGVSYMTAGENIACGQTSPSSVVSAWMNSSGHRENILSSSFTQVGISCYYANGTYYWVQLFIG